MSTDPIIPWRLLLIFVRVLFLGYRFGVTLKSSRGTFVVPPYVSRSAIAAAMIAVLSACGSGASTAIPSSPVVPSTGMLQQMSVPFYAPVLGKPLPLSSALESSEKGSIDDAIDESAQAQSLTQTDGSGVAISTATAVTDSSGNTSMALNLNGFSGQFSMPSLTTFHAGDNTLPSGQIVNIAPSGVVSASVLGSNGDSYAIAATPSANGAYVLSVRGSDGTGWSQLISAVTLSGVAEARVRRDGGCSNITNGIGYGAGIVSGAAWLTAEVAGVTGLEPIAGGAGVVAAGSALISVGAFAIGHYFCRD